MDARDAAGPSCARFRAGIWREKPLQPPEAAHAHTADNSKENKELRASASDRVDRGKWSRGESNPRPVTAFTTPLRV